jgi:26S proteasome regulatory subunit T1
MTGWVVLFDKGVKELDTGLAMPNLWDIPVDRKRMSEEHPLQVNFM